MTDITREQDDSTQKLIKAVDLAVSKFVDTPRKLIEDYSETAAELYVSSTLGLDDESFTKKVIKDQFINMFIDKIKWAI